MSIAQPNPLPFLLAPSGDLRIPIVPIFSPSATQDEPGASSIYFSLVIPTYNESRNIEKVVQQLVMLLDPVLPNRYELIVVDDDSPDETWRIAQSLMSDYPPLRVMRRQQERGLSTAVIRGWQAARGEILGVIDGDLQHPPEVLLKLLVAIDQGADLSVASRHTPGGGVSHWSLTRRLLSRGAQLLGLMVLPKVVDRVSDPMSGYFLVRRGAIAEQTLSPIGYKILVEVLGRGLIRRITEVGYVFREREMGESKVTRAQYVEYLRHLLRLRFSTGRLGRLRQRVNFPTGRFLRFGAVGISGLCIDMGLLYLLHGVLGFGVTRSAIAAAEVAIVNNFIWNDRWTFSDISRQQQQGHKTIKRFFKFNIICLMGVILKVLLLKLLLNAFHLNPYLSNLLAIAIVTIWNFWINLKLSWRVTQVK